MINTSVTLVTHPISATIKLASISVSPDIVSDIEDALDALNGEVIAGDSFDKIDATNATKLAIETSIEAKGVIVPDEAPFSDYPGYIDAISTCEGDAVVADVLAGKTFSNDTERGIIGTMPNIGQENFTPSTINQSISLGYHDGTGVVSGDADLVSDNIKAGVSIFGIDGSPTVVDTVDGYAAPEGLLSGMLAYSEGMEIVGTMTKNVKVMIMPGVAEQYIAEGYHDGTGIVHGDADLISDNIKAGVSIFGIDGTYDQTYDADFIGTDWVPAGILFTITVDALAHGLGETDALYVAVKDDTGDRVRTHVNVAVDGTVTITANYNFDGSYTIVGGA